MVVRRGGLLRERERREQLDICRRQANIGCTLNLSFGQRKVRKTENLKTFRLCRLIEYSYDKVKTSVLFFKTSTCQSVVIYYYSCHVYQLKQVS